MSASTTEDNFRDLLAKHGADPDRADEAAVRLLDAIADPFGSARKN